MPKIVDHDDRRADIARAAGRVLVRKGIESLTLRDIAREANCSPGILAHYFRDRTEILAHALEYFSEASFERQNQSLSDAETLEDAIVRELPSENAEVSDEWATRFQLWARSATNPEWAAVQAKVLEEQREHIGTLLSGRGYGATERERQLLADLLIALSIGLCVCNYFDPPGFDATKVRKIVRHVSAGAQAGSAPSKPSTRTARATKATRGSGRSKT